MHQKPPLSAQPDFRALFKAAPTPYLVLAADRPYFTVLDANDAYLRTVEAERGQVVGLGIFEVLETVSVGRTSEAAAALRASLDRVLETRSPDRVQIEEHGAGGRFWQVLHTPLAGSDGEVASILHFPQDATAAVLAERMAERQDALQDSAARMRESEDRFRNMAEYAPVMMWVTDREGRCTYLNRRWYEFTGQTEAQALGFGWLEAIHPDDKAEAERVFREANAAMTRFRVEYRLRGAEGVYRWAIDAASPRFGERGEYLGYVGSVIDIDDWRRAERALHEGDARLRTLTDNLPAGMVYQIAMNRDGTERRFTFVSQSHVGLTGVAAEAVMANSQIPYELILPEYRQALAEAEAVSIRDLSPFDVEAPFRHAGTGEIRWSRIVSAPREMPDGSLVWDGLQIDITDRYRTEERLRESEARFRAVAEALPGFVWTADDRGNLDYTSPRWHTYSGLGPEDSIGHGWASSVHPEDQALALDRWSRAVETATPYETEFRLRSADGGYRWWLARALTYRDGRSGALRWVGVCTELEDIVTTRETLARSREDLAKRVEERTRDRDRMWRLSTDVMLVARFDASIAAVNPAWTTLFGWHEDELIDAIFMDFIHPDDVAKTIAEVERLEDRLTTLRFENRYRCKDGSYRWISWTAVPDEQFIHAVGRDVTEEKERASALRIAEEALRQAQKMEAVGQLTGGVAHDFNNLLTIIRSSTDLLRRPNLSEERRQRYMDAIAETVGRASKLTGQLLAFARRQALKPEVFNVSGRILSINEMTRTIVGARIRIVADIACDPCFVEADASQFETALVNMVVNARDAMDGEGVLTVSVRATEEIPAIRGHAGGAGSFVAVSVADTGCGIAPDKILQIFEPFFTTKEVGKGTGLGLSQVYGFAKQSGGDVAVESEVGRGTTFTLYLPQAQPDEIQEPPPEAKRSERPEAGSGRRVLLVEDNVEVGQFSTQILQDLGYETTWASNADEALTRLSDGLSVDVVFTDVVMPGMSGVELAHEIRRRYPGLPVVLTSGYSHVLVDEGSHGFDLLQKPYAAEELSRVLRRVTKQVQDTE